MSPLAPTRTRYTGILELLERDGIEIPFPQRVMRALAPGAATGTLAVDPGTASAGAG